MTLKPREKVTLSDLENKIKSARNSNDYVLINFGKKGEFIKLAFCKDQTYCIGYNFWNMEFAVRTNIMLKQYPKSATGALANWLYTWVTRLNRQNSYINENLQEVTLVYYIDMIFRILYQRKLNIMQKTNLVM